ncbi:MAG: peptidoglycan-binding protein [Clostridia bacterium]|nr:peptidoglycan-binding protein [Clostridia bacterium]
MRLIDDKIAFIKEIQRFLIKVTPFEDAAGLSESGIYDEVTKSAVRKFKTANGLLIDTVVDYRTFELLYAKYLAFEAENRASLKRGDSGDEVLELNMMLRRVGAGYSEFKGVKNSAYYSESTENAVIYLKERFGMEACGEADGAFSERLKKEYLLIKGEK